jgi:hypothetical protein
MDIRAGTKDCTNERHRYTKFRTPRCSSVQLLQAAHAHSEYNASAELPFALRGFETWTVTLTVSERKVLEEMLGFKRAAANDTVRTSLTCALFSQGCDELGFLHVREIQGKYRNLC